LSSKSRAKRPTRGRGKTLPQKSHRILFASR
jgi:hypothetical protein